MHLKDAYFVQIITLSTTERMQNKYYRVNALLKIKIQWQIQMYTWKNLIYLTEQIPLL